LNINVIFGLVRIEEDYYFWSCKNCGWKVEIGNGVKKEIVQL
jgi:hypothetical protein